MELSNTIRNQIKAFVRKYHSGDNTGHGMDHIERVVRNAVFIAHREGADIGITELAAWLHDIDDKKLVADPAFAKKERRDFLNSIGIAEETITDTEKIIASVSFSQGGKAVSLEQQVVQDADRLDAIGAIGIFRSVSYGTVYKQSAENTLQHFDEKLLCIYENLWTVTAKQEAKVRHEFMEVFIQQYEREQSFAREENL